MDDAEFIEQPQLLGDKVSRSDVSVADLLDDDTVFRELGEEFEARLPADLAAIRTAFSDLCQEPDDRAAADRLFRRVHDLKGTAGTFDYTLISVIGNDLCRFIERPVAFSSRRLKVVELHIDAMERIAAEKILGDGGELGIDVVDALHRVTQKVLNE